MGAFLQSVIRIAATVALGGFLSASLVLLAPGFGLDETQLDPRWSAASLARLREHSRVDNLAVFYARFLLDYGRGDLGYSTSLQRPVRDLIRERIGVSARALIGGLALGWAAALGAVLLATRYRYGLCGAGLTLSSTLIQCFPVALVAMTLAVAGGRGAWLCAAVLGLVLYARLAQYLKNLLASAGELPHVRAARALGCGEWRTIFRSIVWASAPEIFSLAGVSVGMAAGLQIPIEALVDVPGIGQLAWQAALSRDVYLLVNLVMFMSVIVLAANSAADWLARGPGAPHVAHAG